MSQGNPINRTAILAEFNRIVLGGLGQRSQAPWYDGQITGPYKNIPGGWEKFDVKKVEKHNDLGPRAEPDKTMGEFNPAGTNMGNELSMLSANAIFDRLYELARQLTRVRIAKYEYQYGSPRKEITSNPQLTALRTTLLLSPSQFAKPSVSITPGTEVSMATFTNYISQLKARLDNARNNNGLAHTFTACHANTQVPTCHGSRGRR